MNLGLKDSFSPLAFLCLEWVLILTWLSRRWKLFIMTAPYKHCPNCNTFLKGVLVGNMTSECLEMVWIWLTPRWQGCLGSSRSKKMFKKFTCESTRFKNQRVICLTQILFNNQIAVSNKLNSCSAGKSSLRWTGMLSEKDLLSTGLISFKM